MGADGQNGELGPKFGGAMEKLAQPPEGARNPIRISQYLVDQIKSNPGLYGRVDT